MLCGHPEITVDVTIVMLFLIHATCGIGRRVDGNRLVAIVAVGVGTDTVKDVEPLGGIIGDTRKAKNPVDLILELILVPSAKM
jgi:hypothetical protein